MTNTQITTFYRKTLSKSTGYEIFQQLFFTIMPAMTVRQTGAPEGTPLHLISFILRLLIPQKGHLYIIASFSLFW